MAQILMLASDILNAGRLDGDPVSVVDDAHIFSAEEDKRRWLAEGGSDIEWDALVPQFQLIIITGMPLNIAQRITQTYIRGAEPGDPEYNAPDESDRIVQLGPHRWRLGKQDRLPPNIANQLNKNGFIEVPYDVGTLNNYIVDRQVIPDGLPNAGQEMDDFISTQPIRYYIDGNPVFE